MAGHFEKGVWVEEKPPLTYRSAPEPLYAKVVVHVDDSELKELKNTLESLNDLVVPPRTFWGRMWWLIFGDVIK